ncbi:hypothetical protein GCM10009751_24250 [Myceligenerans crystallogenes]|uniref:Uncharacterized protein n=1 Tax=Myceligenerans crystallogenes TaxID=316335 RepID=A0ABN2NFA6_9MICO
MSLTSSKLASTVRLDFDVWQPWALLWKYSFMSDVAGTSGRRFEVVAALTLVSTSVDTECASDADAGTSPAPRVARQAEAASAMRDRLIAFLTISWILSED